MPWRGSRCAKIVWLGQIHHGVVHRGLPGGHRERVDPPLEHGHPALQHIDRRVGDAGVAVALGLEVEQRGAVRGAVEGIGNRLVDRYGDRFGGRIAVEAPVQGNGLRPHVSPRIESSSNDDSYKR